jgi:hypothetical protein
MTYVAELESLIARVWSGAYGCAATDVLVTPHGHRAGIVVRAPGLETFDVDLDGVLKRCARRATEELRNGRPDHCRAQELIQAAYECNRLLDPRGEHEADYAPAGAERAA